MKNLFLLLVISFVSVSARADQWSDQMVSIKKIDFGVIATGSETIKQVAIKNVHSQTVRISEVKTSCICASATLVNKQYSIEPGQTAIIEVQMDTKRFKQRKDSNLLVTFNSPRYVQHRIPITAYIRTDVVFTPGKVQFNSIEYGKPATAVVDIAYAGRPDWAIDDIKFQNPNMKATLSAPSRSNGLLKFKLTMSLDGKAPVGSLRDVLTIVTNDRTNPYIPLLIEGAIAPDISVSPSILQVGSVSSGKAAKVKLLLRGKNAFTVSNVDCAGMSGCFKADLKEKASRIHSLVVEFTPPNRPGKFTEELIVGIKNRAEPLRLNISGTIVN